MFLDMNPSTGCTLLSHHRGVENAKSNHGKPETICIQIKGTDSPPTRRNIPALSCSLFSFALLPP